MRAKKLVSNLAIVEYRIWLDATLPLMFSVLQFSPTVLGAVVA